MRRAIDGRAHGIAVSVIDRRAFNNPTAEALRRGIPVVSYNADGGVGNRRLAYIGQDLYQSGLKFGARIVELVQSGEVFLFIATPGQLNIQPRIDGALDAIKDSGKPIRATVVATGPGVVEERARIEATYAAHKKLRGMFAVDGGSTQGVADVMRKHKLRSRGVRAGGYDLLPRTLRAIADGHLDFTIDQQPYLQGFLPIFQLFMVQLQRRPRRAVGHEHRVALRHAPERAAVPDDDHAVRRQLRRGRVSGHLTRLRHTGHARIALGP